MGSVGQADRPPGRLRLSIATRLGRPEADQMRAQLTAINGE